MPEAVEGRMEATGGSARNRYLLLLATVLPLSAAALHESMCMRITVPLSSIAFSRA